MDVDHLFTIRQVSTLIGLRPSTLRFWEKEFELIKPRKNKKGNRLFTATDVKNLKIIHHLVKEKGMTLAGARKQLSLKWEETDYKYEISENLKNIKGLLLEIRDSI